MFQWLKLAKRVSELEDLMLKLVRRMDDKELDWVEARARCRRLMDRTEKAASRAETAVQSGAESPTPEGMAGAEPGNGHLFLSPSQRRIQEQIKARRRAMGVTE